MAGDSAVLLIEDDEAIRDSLRDLLEGEGHSIACACDGAEGLAQLQASRPCLVLLDWWMPRMDGATFLEAWRTCAAYDPSIPIVLMTGAADEAVARSAAPVGNLRKPVELTDLLRVVAEHCSRACHQS
jgi:CheY-like chemotaxis protein